MLHTFVGHEMAEVKETVRAPFCEYIKSAISLEARAASDRGVISSGHKIEPHMISANAMKDLLDLTFDRYFHTAALRGTPETCRKFVWDLAEIRVDEIACLIDFGVDADRVKQSLEHLAELRASLSESAASALTAQMLRHFTEDLC